MINKLCSKTTNLLIPLFLTVNTYGFSTQVLIPCPSADTVADHALYLYRAYKPTNFPWQVYSDAVIHEEVNGWKIDWIISVLVFDANSMIEAIVKGRQIVKHVTIKKQEYAYRPSSFWQCDYGPGEVILNSWS